MRKKKEAREQKERMKTLREEYRGWRVLANERRDVQRKEDVARWEEHCAECKDNGQRCPKNPRIPKLESTPDVYLPVQPKARGGTQGSPSRGCP